MIPSTSARSPLAQTERANSLLVADFTGMPSEALRIGYEDDIMTAEVLALKNDRKFIPVLRKGD